MMFCLSVRSRACTNNVKTQKGMYSILVVPVGKNSENVSIGAHPGKVGFHRDQTITGKRKLQVISGICYIIISTGRANARERGPDQTATESIPLTSISRILRSSA